MSEQKLSYYEKNREKILEYRKKDPRVKSYAKEYYERNKEEISAFRKREYALRKKTI